jgi:general secretion pathway protein G
MRNVGVMKMKVRGRRAAFTLMEVLIVLAILVVIISLVVPNLMKARDKANNDAAKVQIKSVEEASDHYALDHDGSYPPSIEAMMSSSGNDQQWKGPYFKGNKPPADSWNSPIQYQSPGTHQSEGRPDVWSMGKDKTSGTADDITNW